jgi:hypothetical protein
MRKQNREAYRFLGTGKKEFLFRDNKKRTVRQHIVKDRSGKGK